MILRDTNVRRALRDRQRGFLLNPFRFGAGGPWTPANLAAHPVLWVNDDSSATDVGSGACSQWNDISGNAYHLTQGTSANRPLIVSSGLNSRRTIRFDGSNDMLLNNSTGARSVAQNVTSMLAFLVYKRTATDSTQRVATHIPTGTSGTDTDRFSIYCGSPSDPNKVIGIVRRNDADSAASIIQSAAGGTAWQMVMLRTDYTNGDGWLDIDGANNQTNTSFVSNGSTQNTLSTYALTMGGTPSVPGSSPGTNNAANIEVAEYVVSQGNLSSTEVDKLFGYAAHRWGLTSSLPSGHPYKTVAPTQ